MISLYWYTVMHGQQNFSIVCFLPLPATSVGNLENINTWHATLILYSCHKLICYIIKEYLHEDLKGCISSLVSRVAVEGHNVVTHVTDTTHIT
jgi:hypothetical protein